MERSNRGHLIPVCITAATNEANCGFIREGISNSDLAVYTSATRGGVGLFTRALRERRGRAVCTSTTRAVYTSATRGGVGLFARALREEG